MLKKVRLKSTMLRSLSTTNHESITASETCLNWAMKAARTGFGPFPSGGEGGVEGPCCFAMGGCYQANLAAKIQFCGNSRGGRRLLLKHRYASIPSVDRVVAKA